MEQKTFDGYLRTIVNERWAYAQSVFSSEECNQIINLVLNSPQKYSLDNARVGGDDRGEAVINEIVRKGRTAFLNLDDENVQWVWERVISAINQLNDTFFNFNVDRIECLQFSEYKDKKRGFYSKHVDQFYSSGINRKLSLSIQLSDPKDYKGGDLLLHHSSTPSKAEKKQGTVIVFPSYTLHEVTPVTKGTRYSLVGWVLGPKFV